MKRRMSVRQVVKEAIKIQEAAKLIYPNMLIGKGTQAAFEAKIDALDAVNSKISAKLITLIGLRNQRDVLIEDAWDDIKRVRASAKGRWGDDSVQYQELGGRRRSDIRSPLPKSSPSSSRAVQ